VCCRGVAVFCGGGVEVHVELWVALEVERLRPSGGVLLDPACQVVPPQQNPHHRKLPATDAGLAAACRLPLCACTCWPALLRLHRCAPFPPLSLPSVQDGGRDPPGGRHHPGHQPRPAKRAGDRQALGCGAAGVRCCMRSRVCAAACASPILPCSTRSCFMCRAGALQE
jgi:hypothetical protein